MSTTTTGTIPTDADSITADWLTGALRSTGTIDETVAVTDFEIEPVGVGIGLVGCLARVTPTYAGDDTLVAQAPERFIAKFPAPEEGSRFVAMVLGMYRKEVGFYRHLADQCALPHATCHYADHDAESDDFIILMEDLSSIDGHPSRVVDQIGGCDREDAEAAIDALADFHAGYWNDEALTTTDWLGALCDAPFPDAVAMSYDQSWEPVQELFGEYLTPEVKDFGDRYTALLPDLVARLSEGPFTLSHGDYRLDNIFFGAGDVPLKVCDWQLVDRSRGARDLAYFTSQSLIPELRAEIERSLVERYVARLARHGVEDYPFDIAWHDYRLATAFGFVYPVIAGGSLDHADERATNLTGEMFRRSVRAIVELDALELV